MTQVFVIANIYYTRITNMKQEHPVSRALFAAAAKCGRGRSGYKIRRAPKVVVQLFDNFTSRRMVSSSLAFFFFFRALYFSRACHVAY